ncbi:MAG TPA: hypothetical protein VF855_07680 [Acidimicrobiales bacterium]
MQACCSSPSSSPFTAPPAMLTPGQKATVEREVLLDLLAELIESRALLARLGGDLREVVRRDRS